MRLYVQSKSGDVNTVLNCNTDDLFGAMDFLRRVGSYPAKVRNKDVAVPFEEIEYIREATDGDETSTSS